MSLVAGDANFQMSSTSLTLVGFTQPNVSRSLIENTSNIEKGLSQRFTWIFPKPTYAVFESLQPVDSTFTQALGKIISVHCIFLFGYCVCTI